MKFGRYMLKNILSVCCIGIILSVGTTGIWCPGWAGRDEEMLKYLEEKHRQEGYTTVNEFSDQPQSSNPQVTTPQQSVTPQTPVTPVKTCNHNYEVKIVREATCDGTGEMVFTCKSCKDSYKEVVPKTGNHIYNEAVTQEPSCTEKGIKTFTCNGCADSYTEEIDAIGHMHESKVTKEADCTHDGEMTFTCTNCNDTYTEPVAATGHTSSEWKITKENGTFSEGIKEQTCIACGTVLGTEIIPGKYPIAYLYVGIGVAVVFFVGAIVLIKKRK